MFLFSRGPSFPFQKGPGHVFYYKSQVGPAVPLEADSAFEALIGI